MPRTPCPAARPPRFLAALAATVLLIAGCSSDETDTGDLDAGAVDAGAADVAAEDATDAASADAAPDDATADVDTAATGDVLVPNEADPLGLPLNLIPQGDEFMVAIIPDTQIYARDFPLTFERHIRWLADRAAEYNIVFVSHVGDIVQTGENRPEWDNADAAYAWLRDAGVPHGLAIGSHDFSKSSQYDGPLGACDNETGPHCKAQMYIEHFGAAQYADKAWYGGASPSGASSFQLIEAGGLQLLFLHLMHDTPKPELTWAGEVLDAHPGALVHLTTHRYMFDYRLTEVLPPPLNVLKAGRFNAITYSVGGQSAGPTTAKELFADFIIQHPNIFMVHCGHVDAEFRLMDKNTAGLPVYQALVDFQDMSDGGGGWLRLLHFKPSEDKVEALTVSTETGALRENGDGFTHSLEILDHYKTAYAKDLEEFGLDAAQLDALLEQVSQDTPERQQYYDSLYGAGERDSRYTLDVDFDAYVSATQ